MKATNWKNTAKLIKERQSQAATADTSKLSSLPLSELTIDESRPPTVLQGPYIPLSTSTPICIPQGNQQTMDSALDESPFQQVIPSIPQQSPFISSTRNQCKHGCIPSIPFSRRVINDIEEKQGKALKDTVEGTIRSTNTSPTSEVEEQAEEAIVPGVPSQAGITHVNTREETMQPESSEIEDTSIKKVDRQEDLNTGPTEVQNIGNTDERAVPDLNGSQIEENGTTPDNDRDDYISDDQDIDLAMQDNQTPRAS